MKPNWKDAPEWAQWLAKDSDGEWYWFEFEPFSYEGERGTWFPPEGRCVLAGEYRCTPRKESRPAGV